jgi:hypothetical protein
MRRWTAPEIFSGEEKRETEPSCVYRLGMIAYSILTGTAPFDEFDENTVLSKRLHGDQLDLTEIPDLEFGFKQLKLS